MESSEEGRSSRGCPQCGHENPPWLLICARCGAALPETSAPPPPSEEEEEVVAEEPSTVVLPEAEPSPVIEAGAIACPQCGGPIYPGERFCARCGAPHPGVARARATAPLWAFTGVSCLAMVVLFVGAFLWFLRYGRERPQGPGPLPSFPQEPLPALEERVKNLAQNFFTALVDRREEEAGRFLLFTLSESERGRLLGKAARWVRGWKQVQQVKVLGRSELFWDLVVEGDGGSVSVETVVVAPPFRERGLRLAQLSRLPDGELRNRFREALAEKDKAKAITVLASIAKAQPEADAVWRELGNLYGEQREPLKAMEAYKQALRWDEDNPLYLNNYAWFASLAEKELERALEAARRAVQAEPRNGAYLDTLGWVLYQLGNYQDAQKYLEEAVRYAQTSGDEAAATYHLGVLLAKQGRRKEALQYLRRSLRVEPQGEFAEDAKKWMERLSGPTIGA